MYPIEESLYTDPQCSVPKRCPRCRREVYPPSYTCSHCGEAPV